MERAFHELGRQAFEETAEGRRSLVRAYGLRPDLLAVTQVWQDDNGLIVAAKGAPEAIADLCRASTGELAALKTSVDAMAAEGLRVLAVARARIGGGELRTALV
jgi:Ca2+-transporting ATPase